MMRTAYALALATIALGVACQDATQPAAPRANSSSPFGSGVGSLNTEAVILGPGTGNDTLTLGPLQGALVKVYKKEVTVVQCDSSTTTPTCAPRTYTVPNAVDVPTPWGQTLRGALVASGTTGSNGQYLASGLEAWVYFTIVDGPAGGGYHTAFDVHIPVVDGQTATSRVMVPRD